MPGLGETPPDPATTLVKTPDTTIVVPNVATPLGTPVFLQGAAFGPGSAAAFTNVRADRIHW